jgi:putative membrane protein
MKTYILPLLMTALLSTTACETGYDSQEAQNQTPQKAEAALSPADLNDLEIAHVAYTADNIDIRYANIALKRSSNPEIHAFANTMIRDHTAVNELALALLDKLGATAQDNFLSQKLNADADVIAAKLSGLSGKEFDQFYASNELGYHKAVNDLVENSFIPNIENAEVKALFEAGLEIFTGHQAHADMMVKALAE